jgi:hypothetical protein
VAVIIQDIVASIGAVTVSFSTTVSGASATSDIELLGVGGISFSTTVNAASATSNIISSITREFLTTAAVVSASSTADLIRDWEFSTAISGASATTDSQLKVPALYATDFSEYTEDAHPADWTERWHTTDAETIVNYSATFNFGDAALDIDHSADGRYFLSWDDLDGSEDIELLSLNRWAGATSGAIQGLSVRGSGTSTTEQAYTAYFADADNEVRLVKYNGDGSVTEINTFSMTLTNDPWYWLRLRVEGTSLKVKAWDYGEAEPEAWDLEETDSDISGGGWAGVVTYKSDWEYVDWFSVGIDGPSASYPVYFSTSVTGVSATSDITLSIPALDFDTTVTGVSSTSAIDFNKGITFSATVSAASLTSDVALSVALEFLATIAAISTTSDVVLLTETGIDDLQLLWPAIYAETSTSSIQLTLPGEVLFSTTIAASSATSPVTLDSNREFSATVSAASSTFSIVLGVEKSLATAATGTSVSSDVVLAVLREVTSSASGASLTSTAGVAIARDVSASISAASATTSIVLNTGVLFSTTVAGLTATSAIDALIYRELLSYIYAESSVSQPVVSLFTEDPTDDEIIAQARNYRVVIPGAALSGSSDQIRILFRAHSKQDTVITASSFGERLGTTVDFSVTPIRLTFNDGGNGTTITGGTEQWSDWIDFEIDDTVDHLVHVFINENPHYYVTKDQAGPTYIRAGAVNDTMIADVDDGEYSSSSKHYHVVEIQARMTPDVEIVRELSTAVGSSSTVGNIRLGEYVLFGPNIAARSGTAFITLGVLRPLQTTVAGASTASEITLSVVSTIEFSTTIAAASATSNINLILGDMLLFSSVSAAASATSASLNIERPITSLVNCVSTTSESTLTLDFLLNSLISGTTITGNVALLVFSQLSALVAAHSAVSDILLQVFLRLAVAINATTQTSTILFAADVLPIVIDLRIFTETPEYTWITDTAALALQSATAAREYESETPVLTIENRTGTEVISLPYEVKPYPF